MNQPLAFIHKDAKIAQNVVIEPFTVIEKDVEIDEGTWIGSNVTIMNGARIGKNCKIFPGAVISAPPQDLKYNNEQTFAIIGDNTVVRECATINKATTEKWKTIVGNNCLLMAYTHIAHDCHIGNNVILANSVNLGGHVEIEDYAIIGGLTAVHQFVKIGKHSMISGGSLVRKDTPPYIKAGREPLSFAGLNSIGLRRRGYSAEKIAELQEIYRIIFLKNMSTSKALNLIETNLNPSPERDEIITFIKEAKRGIIKGYSYLGE